jgi:tetratricopeptide (TPR) repeat protein
MRAVALLVTLVIPATAAAQVAPPPPPTIVQVQQWFEAGLYDQVIQAAPPIEDPKAKYLAGMALERLKRMDEARQTYTQLAERGEGDPWAAIGRSAQALTNVPATPAAVPAPRQPMPGDAAEDPMATAEQAAVQAVQQAMPPAPGPGAPAPAAATTPPHPALAMAHYQLGLVQAHKGEHENAAASFGRAATAEPTFAYAHYYAGLMYSRFKRVDQTAIYWEAFLKLAPKAPEAPQVLSIIRTLRGR